MCRIEELRISANKGNVYCEDYNKILLPEELVLRDGNVMCRECGGHVGEIIGISTKISKKSSQK